MKLFGTLTSPYVRRVRAVTQDLSLPCTLVDVTTDEGQAELRRRNPLWKVPTVEIDGELLWDSDVILDRLFADHGIGSLRAETSTTRWGEARLRATVDEMLGTQIKLFYLKKDGVDADAAAYLTKDSARVRSTLAWLNDQVRGPWCSPVDGFGRTELTLYTALDWLVIRGKLSLGEWPELVAFVAAHAERPVLATTAPPQ